MFRIYYYSIRNIHDKGCFIIAFIAILDYYFCFEKAFFVSYLLKYSQEDMGFFVEDHSYPDYEYLCHHGNPHLQQ